MDLHLVAHCSFGLQNSNLDFEFENWRSRYVNGITIQLIMKQWWRYEVVI